MTQKATEIHILVYTPVVTSLKIFHHNQMQKKKKKKWPLSALLVFICCVETSSPSAY